MAKTTTPPHIAIIPTPGMGHLIPLVELASRLTELNFCITFLIANDGSPPTQPLLSILHNLPTSSISHHFLPPIDLSDLPPDTPIETRFTLFLTRSESSLRDLLRVLSESTRLVALVVDHLAIGSPLFDLAYEFGILPYMFFLSSAFGLCFGFSLPKLDNMYECEYRDLPKPVQLFPGSVPVHGVDFVDPVQDRRHEVYKWMLDLVGRYPKAAGILVNSFWDLEPTAFKYLIGDGRRENNIPPVYPIGPVIQTGSRGDCDIGSCCLKWLDEQPNESVIFVSFGSGGTLSHEQLIELAFGLEMSGQRFLWVVRSPHDKISNALYFSMDNPNKPLEFLPDGFLDRVNGLGLVVPSWAPQIQVLGHKSTGGFLTHCGWNSVLESIVHGVPLIAWPLFAEQKFNAVLVTEDLRVALRVKPNEKSLVQREQIAQYVKCLIQGDEGKVLRENMRNLKHAASVALDENGSSRQSLAKAAQVLMSHKSTQNGCA